MTFWRQTLLGFLSLLSQTLPVRVRSLLYYQSSYRSTLTFVASYLVETCRAPETILPNSELLLHFWVTTSTTLYNLVYFLALACIFHLISKGVVNLEAVDRIVWKKSLPLFQNKIFFKLVYRNFKMYARLRSQFQDLLKSAKILNRSQRLISSE